VAAFDFPASPTNGQTYSLNGVLFTYNGYGWKQQSASGPVDAAYVDAADALRVLKAGDTMSGHLSLPTAPAAANAVRKDYVDTSDALKADKTYTDTQDAATLAAAKVYAAPLDALAYSGMQINGSMEVGQEKGTNGSTAGYACDGWALSKVGTMVITAAIGFNLSGFVGLPWQLYITVQTGQTILSGTDNVGLYQAIEGYRIIRLAWGTSNAKPLTIGFWTAHHRTGTYAVAFRNAAQDRSCVCTYTQNVADVPEYKTITIPGDTTGTWGVNNTVGLYVSFMFAVGTTGNTSTFNVWQAGTVTGANGQSNTVATTDVFRISGIVILPGTQAPTAAQSPLIMRPFDQELVTCQRYWRNLVVEGPLFSSSTTTVQTIIRHPSMRGLPTITARDTLSITNGSVNFTQSAVNAGILAIPTADYASYSFGNFTGLTVGASYMTQMALSASRIALDARL